MQVDAGGGAGALSPVTGPRSPTLWMPTGSAGRLRRTLVRALSGYLTAGPQPHILLRQIGIGHAQAGIRDSQQNTAFAADCAQQPDPGCGR